MVHIFGGRMSNKLKLICQQGCEQCALLRETACSGVLVQSFWEFCIKKETAKLGYWQLWVKNGNWRSEWTKGTRK